MPEAEANIRGYFTANPQEYYELRGILAPIGDTQRACNVSVLPPDLAAWRAQARTEGLPPMLRELVRLPSRRAAGDVAEVHVGDGA